MFFVEHWVDYQKRHDYLLDADIGVSTHLDHVETNFSFRTRILDYLWARLPVVCTGGDAMGELIEREQIGLVVPPADTVALADALERLLKDDEFRRACRRRLDEVAPRFTWGEVAQPLLEFCRRPRRAADLRVELGDPVPGRTTEAARTVVGRARLAAGAVSTSVARDGWRATASKVAARLPGPKPGARGRRR